MPGFRDDDDEDEDLGDLLVRPAMATSTYAFNDDTEAEEDLSSNPFADMQSSRANIYSPSPFASTSYEPQSPERVNTATSTAASSPYDAPRSFSRENAPEPETPAFTRTVTAGHDYSPSPAIQEPASPSDLHQSPFQSAYSPPALAQQSPFASPLTSPTRLTSSAFESSPYAPRAPKPDLSDLLGEEKPILPQFSKRRDQPEGVAGPLGAKVAVLPVSSIGKRSVGRPLAALLGLEVDETEEEEDAKGKAAANSKENGKAVTRSKPAQVDSKPAVAPVDAVPPSKSAATPSATESPAPAPAPPTITEPVLSARAPGPASNSLAALSTPLPPSPSQSPLPGAESLSAAPGQSRASSRAGSVLSVESSEANMAYDALVSPMETEETSSDAWPADKERTGGQSAVEGLEQKLEALQVTSEGEQGTPKPSSLVTPTETRGDHIPVPSTSTEPTASETSAPAVDPAQDPFAQYTYSQSSPAPTRTFRSHNGSIDDGQRDNDTDSLRGTYTRSLEVSEGGEEASDSLQGSSTLTETELGNERSVQSPPLPPVPTMPSPVVQQTSPRSAAMGGSLGPTFIITVEDPHKIGSSLNPASQHTVYTVHTRTTSKAFRKSDFSVLRRFSHFLWLFEALTLNNPGVIVPGMPEKSAMGRFGSEFVENRRSGLQAALMKIVAHPMLVGDPDLRLFLESDTFSVDIKQRKIDAVPESKGIFASLTNVISGPAFVEFDEYFDNRKHTLETFETQLRALLESLSAAAKVRHALHTSFAELQVAFLALAQCDLSPTLRRVLEDAARVQERIKRLNEEQSASEDAIGGLNSVLEGYARLCASARLVFGARIKAYHVWQTAEERLRKTRSAHEKAKRAGRVYPDSASLAISEVAETERRMIDARQDFEDVSKLTKAEMARFDKEKVDDVKKAIEDYADGMAARQREVVAVWQKYHDMLVDVVAAHTQPSGISQAATAD